MLALLEREHIIARDTFLFLNWWGAEILCLALVSFSLHGEFLQMEKKLCSSDLRQAFGRGGLGRCDNYKYLLRQLNK